MKINKVTKPEEVSKMTKTDIENIIKGLKSERQIKAALNRAGIEYYQDEYSDNMNIKIENEAGVLRIYKSYRDGEIVVQQLSRVNFEYSGIPVFFSTDKYF